jgi:hypothetical protein
MAFASCTKQRETNMDTEMIRAAKNDVVNAERALIQARQNVANQNAINLRLRATFNKALTNFRATYPVITREQLVRDQIKAERQLLQDIKDGKVAPAEQPRIADSVVDRERAPWGGADAQVRKGNRLGSNRGFVDRDGNLRRALPRSMYGRVV